MAPTSYILCGTPRTGSTLLCSLLASTSVAGRPESYFREPDQQTWAHRFGVPVSDDGTFDYTEFVSGAVRSGTTANGVFAARVMWGTLPVIMGGLDPHEARSSDVSVLEGAFGPLRFVHLRRRHVVEQAVSWARAEQTSFWQHGDEARAEPRFDLDQLDHLVEVIEQHDAAWRSWFAAEEVDPLDVDYESVVDDPASAVRTILRWIGAEAPDAWVPVSPHQRQAGTINTDWARRYLAARF